MSQPLRKEKETQYLSEEDVDVDPGGDHHDDEHLQSHDYDDQSVKTFMIMMVSQSRP